MRRHIKTLYEQLNQKRADIQRNWDELSSAVAVLLLSGGLALAQASPSHGKVELASAD